jgi:hypothetical protein
MASSLGVDASADVGTRKPLRRFTATAGVSYSDGEYGERPDARIVSLPLSLKYQRGPWTTKLTVPFVQIRERRVRRGSRISSSDQGIGDVIASASYTFAPWSDSAPAIALTGKLKLPTAAEGLGSDRFEYTTKLELSKTFYDRFTPYFELGYRVREHSSDASAGNPLLGSLGFSYGVTPSLTLGLAHDFRARSRSGLGDAREIVPSASIVLSRTTRLGLYGVVGLSDASPDLGAGMTLSYRFD